MAERIPVFWDFNNIKLKQAQRELDRTRAKTRQMQGAANRLSGAFKNLGTTLLATFGAVAILAAIGKMIKSLKDLEFQMSKVAAISGATNKQMVQLRNNAIAVGAASKFTATEVGKLQEELARLGFTTSEILKLTDSISALAIVGSTQLGPTALVVAKTLNAFSLQASEGARVTNVMAESFANTALKLELFDAAIRNVGPAAKVAGFSLEETVAILGVLVDNGIEASKAGTDLRRILLEINKAGLTFNEALEMLQLSTDKLGVGFELFKARAVVAGNVLAANTQEIRLLAEGFEDGNREMDEMRRIMEDNLETDFKKMQSAFDALVQKGSPLNQVLRNMVNNFRGLINTISGAELGIEALRDEEARLVDEINIFNNQIFITRKQENDLEKLQQELISIQTRLQFAEKIDEQETARKFEIIGNAIKEAFESEDIEEFIKSLEDSEEKEEIIANIRRIQKLETQELQKAEAELLTQRAEAFEQFKKEQEEKRIQREIDESLGKTIAETALGLPTKEEMREALRNVSDAEEEIADIFEAGAADRKEIRDKELADELMALEASRQILQAKFDLAAALTEGLSNLAKQGTIEQKLLLIFEKALAISRVITLGAIEKAKIGATLGLAAPPFIIAAQIRQAASIAAIVATAIPQLTGFKEGVIDYRGEGTETSDSNLVRISKRESIIKAAASKKSINLLEAINTERLNDDMYQNLLDNQINIDNQSVVNALLGVDHSIKKLPIHQTFFNQKGVSQYIQRENSRIQLLRNRFING